MRKPPPNLSFAVFADLLHTTVLISPSCFFGSGRGRVSGLRPAHLVALVAQLLDPVDKLLSLEVADLTPATVTALGG